MLSLATGQRSLDNQSISLNDPLATRRALYLSMLPYAFCLTKNIQLHPTNFLPGGNDASIRVPFSEVHCTPPEFLAAFGDLQCFIN